jgi:hypothetical protein
MDKFYSYSFSGMGNCIYTDINILLEDNEKLNTAINAILSSINDSLSKNQKVDFDYIKKVYEEACKCTQKT